MENLGSDWVNNLIFLANSSSYKLTPRFQTALKMYRETNKEKINEKIKCDCGCEVLKRALKRHEKTKKHIDLMNEKNKWKK